MLHKEFAIDPAQIQDLRDIRLLESRFGYDKGALISAYPPGWLKEVAKQVISRAGDHQADIISDELKELKTHSVANFGRSYYTGKGWADSAEASHKKQPFHRIVESSLNSPPQYVTSIYDLKNPDFEVAHQTCRYATDLADAASLLLLSAEKVTLIDPYFCLTKSGYRNTLIELMKRCKKTSVCFHVFSEEEKKEPWDKKRKPALKEFAKNQMPKNCSLNWYSISDDGSGYIHPRGLFTAKGGIKYDRGFEVPRQLDQQKTRADVGIMTTREWQQKVEDYNEVQLPDKFRLIHKWSSRN